MSPDSVNCIVINILKSSYIVKSTEEILFLKARSAFIKKKRTLYVKFYFSAYHAGNIVDQKLFNNVLYEYSIFRVGNFCL